MVATDLSSHMLEVAATSAQARGLDNIEFAQRDAENLQFPSQSFNAVMNAYGLMFCPEPSRAVAEAHRVLAPDGRLALVVWDSASHNPFFGLIRDIASSFFEVRDPGPDAPGPFRLASAGRIQSMLEDAGFSSIHVEDMTMTFEFDSVLDYCGIFRDYAWKPRLDAMPPEENARFLEAVTEATRPYAHGGRLRLATRSLCACAVSSRRDRSRAGR